MEYVARKGLYLRRKFTTVEQLKLAIIDENRDYTEI